jgi:hypothetical protein
MKKFRSFIEEHEPKKLIKWLSGKNEKQMFGMLVAVYVIVILVVCVLYLLKRMAFWQVALTFVLLAMAFMPLLKNR